MLLLNWIQQYLLQWLYICILDYIFASLTIYLHPFQETRFQRHKNPRRWKPQRTLILKRVNILYFTKEIPTVIFTSSNHLVSVSIVVIKLNPTIFASVTIYLHPWLYICICFRRQDSKDTKAQDAANLKGT